MPNDHTSPSVVYLLTKKGGNGNVSRVDVGIFLDFAGSSTRTEGLHGAYVQVSGRSRIDPHAGGIERLAMRTRCP